MSVTIRKNMRESSYDVAKHFFMGAIGSAATVGTAIYFSRKVEEVLRLGQVMEMSERFLKIEDCREKMGEIYGRIHEIHCNEGPKLLEQAVKIGEVMDSMRNPGSAMIANAIQEAGNAAGEFVSDLNVLVDPKSIAIGREIGKTGIVVARAGSSALLSGHLAGTASGACSACAKPKHRFRMEWGFILGLTSGSLVGTVVGSSATQGKQAGRLTGSVLGAALGGISGVAVSFAGMIGRKLTWRDSAQLNELSIGIACGTGAALICAKDPVKMIKTAAVVGGIASGAASCLKKCLYIENKKNGIDVIV